MDGEAIRKIVKELLDEHEHKELAFDARVQKELEEVGGIVQRVSTDLASFTLAGRLLWGLVFVFISTLGALLGWGYAEINKLEDEVHAVTSKQAAFEERGTKWGEDLDDDVSRIDDELKELRRKLNGNGNSRH